MFLVVEKRRLWIIFISIFVLCIICISAYNMICYIPKREFVVVVDAGHGGSDIGVFGIESGVSEAEINLLVAYTLKNELENMDVNVVLTRKGKSVLDGGIGTKRDDFNKRKSIILETEPDVVISIHQNKFPDADRRGAQAFYNVNSPSGKELAKATQSKLNLLNNEYVGRAFNALKGEYYLLNCSDYPSCIVECGFLSNREDEKLLISEDYRLKLAKTIASGIYSYLTESAAL